MRNLSIITLLSLAIVACEKPSLEEPMVIPTIDTVEVVEPNTQEPTETTQEPTETTTSTTEEPKDDDDHITYATENIAGVDVMIPSYFSFGGGNNMSRQQLVDAINDVRTSIQNSNASDELLPILNDVTIVIFTDNAQQEFAGAFGYANPPMNQIGLNGTYQGGPQDIYYDALAGVIVHEIAHMYDAFEHDDNIGNTLFNFSSIEFSGAENAYYRVNASEFFASLVSHYLGYEYGANWIAEEAEVENWINTLTIHFN